MNLIIVSLTILGALAFVYSVVYTLVHVQDVALWARILSMIILFGVYVGVVALIMFLLRIPLS